MTPAAPDKPLPALCGLVPRARTAAALVGLAVVLGGCSAYERVSDVFAAPVVLPCPKSWVLAEAIHLTKFQPGSGTDLTDVDYEGEITGIELGCETNVDKKTKIGSMDVDVTVLFNAARGPANRDHKAQLDYFVSVTDNDRKVLYREAFPLSVTFPGNRSQLTVRSRPIILELPLAPDKTGAYYKIFAGFTLTRDQVEFNRTRRKNVSK